MDVRDNSKRYGSQEEKKQKKKKKIMKSERWTQEAIYGVRDHKKTK